MEHAPGRWAVVLAAGAGIRLRPLTQRLWGVNTPKQFCALTGERTLLEQTLDRLEDMVSLDRRLTIISRGDRKLLNGATALAGRLVEQPLNRETAPGIYLPAAHILKTDPLATVLILPSDHYVSSGPAFSLILSRAALLAERWPEKIVLLGAVADGPEQDYGWIEPDWSGSTAGGAMPVKSFWEKPGAKQTAALFEQGALWNTMVMAVKIKTLWAIGRDCLPEMMNVFDELLGTLETNGEEDALEQAYRILGTHNFSRDIMERVPERILVLPITGMTWSDLGRPERALEVLAPSLRRLMA